VDISVCDGLEFKAGFEVALNFETPKSLQIVFENEKKAFN